MQITAAGLRPGTYPAWLGQLRGVCKGEWGQSRPPRESTSSLPLSPANAEELSHSRAVSQCRTEPGAVSGLDTASIRCSSYSTGHTQLCARSLEVEPFFQSSASCREPLQVLGCRGVPGSGVSGGEPHHTPPTKTESELDRIQTM